MCFSATASFVSGTVLIGVGLMAMKFARGTDYKSIAAIPHLFGVQQLLEGVVWLGLQYESLNHLVSFASYGFLIFAWIVWPLYIPYTMRRPEPKGLRRKLLIGTEALGVLVASSLAYVMLVHGVNPEIRDYSIFYNVQFVSQYSGILGVIYLACTIVPPLISSGKNVWILGVITGILYIVSKLLYLQHVLSVWCFFAAIGSLVVLWIVYLNANRRTVD